MQLRLQINQVTVATLTRCNIHLPASTALNEIKPRKVQGRVSCCSCCCVSLARQRSSASLQTKLTRPPVIKPVYFPLGSPFPSYNPHSACLYPFLLSLLPSTRDGAIFIKININKCCLWDVKHTHRDTHTRMYTNVAGRKFCLKDTCIHISVQMYTYLFAQIRRQTRKDDERYWRSSRQILCPQSPLYHTHTHTHYKHIQVGTGRATSLDNDVRQITSKVSAQVLTTHLSLTSLFPFQLYIYLCSGWVTHSAPVCYWSQASRQK